MRKALGIAREVTEATGDVTDDVAKDLNSRALHIEDQLGALLEVGDEELEQLIDDEVSPDDAVRIADTVRSASKLRADFSTWKTTVPQDAVLELVGSRKGAMRIKKASPRVQELFKTLRTKKDEWTGKTTEQLKTLLQNVPLAASRWGENLGAAVKNYLDGSINDVQLVDALEKVENSGSKRGSTKFAAAPELEEFMNKWFQDKSLEDVLSKELGPDNEARFTACIDLIAQVFNGGFEQWVDNGYAERHSDILLDMYNSDTEATTIPILSEILDIFKEAYDLCGGDWSQLVPADQGKGDNYENKWHAFCGENDISADGSYSDDYFEVGDTDCEFMGSGLNFEQLSSVLKKLNDINAGEIMEISIQSGDNQLGAHDDSDIDRINDTDILEELKGMGDSFDITFSIRIGGELEKVHDQWDTYNDIEHIECQSVYYQGNERAHNWSGTEIYRFRHELEKLQDLEQAWNDFEWNGDNEFVDGADKLDDKMYALGSGHDCYAAVFQWIEVVGALDGVGTPSGIPRKSSSRKVSMFDMTKSTPVASKRKKADGLKSFTKEDWYVFAGASRLPSGQEPMIGELKLADWPRNSDWDDTKAPITSGIVIVAGDDDNGVLIQVFDANMDDGMFFVDGLTEEEAIALGNQLCSGTQTPKSLIDAGLTPQFDEETMAKIEASKGQISKFEIEKSMGRMSSKKKADNPLASYYDDVAEISSRIADSIADERGLTGDVQARLEELLLNNITLAVEKSLEEFDGNKTSSKKKKKKKASTVTLEAWKAKAQEYGLKILDLTDDITDIKAEHPDAEECVVWIAIEGHGSNETAGMWTDNGYSDIHAIFHTAAEFEAWAASEGLDPEAPLTPTDKPGVFEKIGSKKRADDLSVTKLVIDNGQLLQLEAEADQAADMNDFGKLDSIYESMEPVDRTPMTSIDGPDVDGPAVVVDEGIEGEVEIPKVDDEEEVIERDKKD